MATAGDGRAPYESSGTGGKFRKRPFRRSVQATPYDRPPTPLRNSNPGLLTKLVDPASRLIYAGAHRLFGAFRKRLPPLLLQGPPEINEEAQKVAQEAVRNNCTGVSEPSTDQGVNSASISAAAGISELEQMLKQKTFTRSEIQRLTALLHSKTIESPDDVVEKDGAKLPSSPSPLLRLEASTSGSLKKHGNERDNFHADISTPIVSSRVLEEEIASPAELAKAYMGSRPMKVAPSALGLSSQAPRQDVKLLNNASGLAKTPITSVAPKTANSFRGLENGFLTPRSRGRSAMYSMARTPYSRGPSTFSQKEINSEYGHGAALTSSQSAWGHEGKMALKRRSSVLDDDIRSGGPLRRTRQKANLLTQGSSLSRDKRELGYTALQQPDTSSQKLLLMNKPEPKVSKDFEENGDTSMRVSGYASVPTKSTQMATKILQQLERLSPKEKKFESTLAGMRDKSPSKLTLNMLHGQALRSLEKVDSPKFLPSPHDSQKSESQHHARSHDIHEPASQSKDKVEENSSRKFPIPRNMLTPVNGDSTVLLKDKAPVVITTASTSKLPAEPPQKKRAFQMSAHEDSLDLDDDVHVNGNVSFPSAEDNKPEASLVANKPVFAEVIQTPTLQEIAKTSALAEVTPVLPEVAKFPEQAELKEVENVASSPKTDVGFLGGSVGEQGIGFKFPTSPPSTTATQTIVLPQSTLQMEKVDSEKDSNNFSLFGATAEKVSPFQFSGNEPSEIKSIASSDPKALDSTSVFNSVSKNDHVKFLAFNKDENGDNQKAANMFGKSESLSSPAFAATSTSGFFSFGSSSKNSSTPDATPASTSPMFSSFTPLPASGANLNSLFNNSSSNVTSASTATVISTTATTITTTAASSTVFSTSVPAPAFSTSLPAPAFSTSLPAPVFSFGSAIAPNSASAAPTSVTETGNTNEKEPKSNMSSSPFASTSFATTTTGSSLFGFSSPAATSTTNNQSQASFFNVSSGSQANTQTSTAVTQAVPFLFGSSTPSIASGSTGIPSSTTSGSSFFGSSAPAFNSTPSFGISFVAASSGTKSGSSTSGSTTSIFGSAASTAAWQPAKSSGFGSTFSSQSSVFPFGTSSTPMPSASTSPTVFGSSNTGASTGSSMFSFTTTGATNSSFNAPSQGQSVFGNSTPVFGATTTSPNNNDQMSMEDSMAEDSMQTPSPVSQFGQAPAAAPGFMFGSATPTPNPAAGLPFQFGGQPNQAPTQNPFQSSSVEFNAGGGSFSLGSGGDKSGRRIVRVKNKNRRK
ncbi:nuclear pore complex protein NUP1-like isoform X1 [Cynara cardunculus var. scolymus]|uniref:nuclear pore complex protein NUP1-like isoform X1 n=1 Tax=Cynara cardunculus var. scolymus TaxID=59895 RepID=UPI000D623791|nr:nuclear pore complex protein NUP1-like isoform X1 [Cynara cardunculus var. scolymus]